MPLGPSYKSNELENLKCTYTYVASHFRLISQLGSLFDFMHVVYTIPKHNYTVIIMYSRFVKIFETTKSHMVQ